MSTQQNDNFINQSKKFHSNGALAYCVKLWQEGENNKMIYNDTEVPKGLNECETLPITFLDRKSKRISITL